MRGTYLFLLFLITNVSLSQKPVVEVVINSIASITISAQKSEYSIAYQIKNTTQKPILFFLIPNALIANAASSMTLFPVYKIYQNGNFEDMDGPFFEFETEEELQLAKIEDKQSTAFKELLSTVQKNQATKASDYYKKYLNSKGEKTDFQWIYYNQRLLNSIIKLEPNETKLFTIKTLWDKNRYIKNDDLEFYLEEKNTIEIELILDLKKSLYKEELSDKELAEIMANPNFIEGVFTSNKVEIKFKE